MIQFLNIGKYDMLLTNIRIHCFGFKSSSGICLGNWMSNVVPELLAKMTVKIGIVLTTFELKLKKFKSNEPSTKVI